MVCKAQVLADVFQGGAQPIDRFTMSEPEGVVRQRVLDFRRSNLGVTADLDQAVQQASERDAGFL